LSLDLHPNNEDLAYSYDGESEIFYWSVSQGECTRKFEGGMSQVRFQSCDLVLFLTVAVEDVVKIFGIETGTFLHTKSVYSVC
jgi:hypothetical protein